MPRGGARDNAGRKREAPPEAALGSNPFEQAQKAGEIKRQRANQEEARREEERREQLAAAPGWKCGKCTYDNDTIEAKLAGKCELCGAARDEDDSEVTTDGRGPRLQLNEAGVLELGQMFVGVVRQSVEGLVGYQKRAAEAQLARFRHEFAKAETAAQATMNEVARLAAEVEESRRRIEGRDQLKDLTEHEEWIATAPNGETWCTVCTEYHAAAAITDQRQLASPWMRGSAKSRISPVNLFVAERDAVRKSVQSHAESQLHLACVAAKKDEANQPKILEALEAVKQLEREAMQNLLRVALFVAKNNKGLIQFEELIYLCDLNGAVVGDREHSRKTAQSMLEVAAQVGQRQMRNFLTTTNPIMGHKPHVFVKADKASDRKMRQFEIINIRVNYQGTPLVLHLAIRPIGTGDYTENVPGTDGTSPEAGSLVCFNIILETLGEYGVSLIRAKPGSSRRNVSVYEVNDFPGVGLGIAEQLRGSAFDGEFCYNGSGENNVKALFKDPVRGYGDSTHETSHDPSHALDLAKESGAKAVDGDYVIAVLHKHVKMVYAHYSTSPKRTRSLLRLCNEWGAKYEELHYLFEVRFVASENRVLRAFLTDLPVIVLDLRLQIADSNIDKTIKTKITGWLKVITGFKFVSTLITQLDIDEAITTFSVRAQSSTALWIDYPDMVDDLKANVRNLQNNLGGNATRRLRELKDGVLWSTVDENAEQPPATADGASVGEGSSTVECVDGEWRVKLKLASAPDATATVDRMLGHQRPCVNRLLLDIGSRLRVPDVLIKLRDVFDFNRMELANTSAAAFEQLQTHGDSAIDWLVQNKFPELDAATIKADALKVRLWAKENHDRFYDSDEAKPSWTKKRRQRHIPKPRLRIAGEGSIMQALFASPVVVGRHVAQYLQIADYMISYDITTADVERIGSHMQLVKSLSRCSQLDSTFAVLTFLSFNLPFLHEVDLDILLEAWRKSGHKLPINKNEATSIVLSRLKDRATSTFFLKDKNEFLPKAADDKFDWIRKRAFGEGAFEDDDADSDSDN